MTESGLSSKNSSAKNRVPVDESRFDQQNLIQFEGSKPSVSKRLQKRNYGKTHLKPRSRPGFQQNGNQGSLQAKIRFETGNQEPLEELECSEAILSEHDLSHTVSDESQEADEPSIDQSLPSKRRRLNQSNDSVEKIHSSQVSSPKAENDDNQNSGLNGDASEFLEHNRFRGQILAMVNDKKLRTSSHAVRQLKIAIEGGGEQCSICKKYLPSGEWAPQHKARCKKGQSFRYNFAKLNGNFFCYFGCQYFSRRNQLIDHLIMHHANQLSKWGISADHLQGRKRKSNTRSKSLKAPAQDNSSNAGSAFESQAESICNSEKSSQNSQIQARSSSKRNSKVELWAHENFGLRLIQRLAHEGSSDRDFLAVESKKYLRYGRELYFISSIDWLRANPNCAYRILTNFEKLKLLSRRYPKLGLKPAELLMHADSSVSLWHQVDIKTPRTFYQLNDLKGARLCFMRAMTKLRELHEKYGIFQGGVSLSTIALDKKQQPYFTEWAYATEKKAYATMVKPAFRTYWRKHELTGPDQLFVQDILALMFSYAQFVSWLNQAKSYFECMQSEIVKRMERPDQEPPYCIMFSGGIGIKELLNVYSFKNPVDYEELYRDFYSFLRNYYSRDDAFDDEWMTKQKWKREQEYLKLTLGYDPAKDGLTLEEIDKEE